jgi:hypothetical protein
MVALHSMTSIGMLWWLITRGRIYLGGVQEVAMLRTQQMTHVTGHHHLQVTDHHHLSHTLQGSISRRTSALALQTTQELAPVVQSPAIQATMVGLRPWMYYTSTTCLM